MCFVARGDLQAGWLNFDETLVLEPIAYGMGKCRPHAQRGLAITMPLWRPPGCRQLTNCLSRYNQRLTVAVKLIQLRHAGLGQHSLTAYEPPTLLPIVHHAHPVSMLVALIAA